MSEAATTDIDQAELCSALWITRGAKDNEFWCAVHNGRFDHAKGYSVELDLEQARALHAELTKLLAEEEMP